MVMHKAIALLLLLLLLLLLKNYRKIIF